MSNDKQSSSEEMELVQKHGMQLLGTKDGLLREAKLHAKISIEFYDQQTKALKDELTQVKEQLASYQSSLLDITKKAIEVKEQNKQLAEENKSLKEKFLPKPRVCIDCGKEDETVMFRGIFNGLQCDKCKSEQDIEDEECR